MKRTLFAIVVLTIACLWVANTATAFHDDAEGGETAVAEVDRALGDRCWQLVPLSNPDPGAGGPSGVCNLAPSIVQAEQNAGSAIDIVFTTDSDGAPPPEADTLALQLRNGEDGTLIREFHNGTTPANGTEFTIYLTDDGTSTGDPRAGVYELFIHAEAGGIDGYSITSRNCESNICRMGVVSGFSWVEKIQDTQPSNFLYVTEPSGTSPITTFLQQGAPFNNTIDHTVQLIDESGTATTTDTVTDAAGTDNITASFSAIDLNQANETYDIRYQLTTTPHLSDTIVQGLLEYNSSASDPSLTFQGSRDVTNETALQADPRVRFDSDGSLPADNRATAQHDVFNRGEQVQGEFFLFNAKDNLITKDLTADVFDENDQIEDTQVLSSVNSRYFLNYTISTTDTASSGKMGSPKTVHVDGSDVPDTESLASWNVSAFYFVDTHTQTNNTLDKDDFPDENSTEEVTFVSGEDTIQAWCHVVGVRQDRNIDTGSQQVTMWINNSNGQNEITADIQTGADGWTSRQNEPATPPTGEWDVTCRVEHDGNIGRTVQDIDVISAFTGDKVVRFVAWNFPNGTELIWVETELGDADIEPDAVPEIRIGRVNGGNQLQGDPTNMQFVEDVEETEMRNANNGSASVNGSLYYYWFESTEATDTELPANYSIVVKAFISGTPVREQQTLRIQQNTGEDTLVTIEGFAEGELWHMLAFGVLFMWTAWNGMPLPSVAAVLGLVDPIFGDAWPLTFGVEILFFAAMFYVHAISNGWIWSDARQQQVDTRVGISGQGARANRRVTGRDRHGEVR